MDSFIKWVLIIVGMLWLPLFITAIYSWFTPIELGYKLVWTICVCAIWIPVIGAWIDANR